MKFFRAISALAALLCPAGWHKNGSNQHGFSAQYYDALENKHEGQECAIYWTSDKAEYDEAYRISLCNKFRIPKKRKKHAENHISAPRKLFIAYGVGLL